MTKDNAEIRIEGTDIIDPSEAFENYRMVVVPNLSGEERYLVPNANFGEHDEGRVPADNSLKIVGKYRRGKNSFYQVVSLNDRDVLGVIEKKILFDLQSGDVFTAVNSPEILASMSPANSKLRGFNIEDHTHIHPYQEHGEEF